MLDSTSGLARGLHAFAEAAFAQKRDGRAEMATLLVRALDALEAFERAGRDAHALLSAAPAGPLDADAAQALKEHVERLSDATRGFGRLVASLGVLKVYDPQLRASLRGALGSDALDPVERMTRDAREATETRLCLASSDKVVATRGLSMDLGLRPPVERYDLRDPAGRALFLGRLEEALSDAGRTAEGLRGFVRAHFHPGDVHGVSGTTFV